MKDRARTRSTGLAGVTNLAVLAPLRNGIVPGIEPISYVGRLRKVLDALHASRRNLRESELLQIFPDVVGRFGIIHSFRYALVKPQAGPAGMPADFGTWRLSLNVTFDGGWEPYMRVIQRDIGPLLDLLFCHSPDYPGSTKVTFEEYCDWVRRHEVAAGLFFADSAGTVEDGDYLAKAEALQRSGASDDALARCHLRSEPQRQADALAAAWKNPERALALPLRTLKGLYRLTPYFQPYADGPVLHRFAQDVLKGPIEFMNRIEEVTRAPALPPHLDELKKQWAAIKGKLLRDELAWLDWANVAKAGPKAVEGVDPKALQAHVLGAGERMTHGCLVLLQVKNPQKALATIADLAERCGPVAPGGIGYLVGFTYQGLVELGVSADRLAMLPQEFFEGMEARSALLGDLRTNHPDRWVRPELEPSGQGSRQRVDFHVVHLVVQVRLDDKASTDLLHPRLKDEVQALGQAATGLRVLAHEPMRSYRDDKDFHAVGHMGIADGLSQPKLPLGATNDFNHYNDQVSAGELLLGYANDRGDAKPGENLFLHNGTFLAVRKLRQFMDRLDKVAPVTTAPGKALLERMVGRAADGAPLHGLPAGFRHENDFNFDSQAASDACPFHSHVRRLNPRDGRAYTPRILRRGMSWGKRSATNRTDARGVMFMAYCASLAEQFEVIQRWVAGGNASGVGSAQGDPLLRVPKEGETCTFRYLADGKVQRVELPKEPLVQLQWGLYAFVPSLDALRRFVEFTKPAELESSPPPNQGLSELEATRALLEDREKSELVWEWVRNGDQRAPQDKAYGHLVGTLGDVLDVLRDSGDNYSVRGYAERMEGSIGLNLLGMDPTHPRRANELGVNKVIAAVSEGFAFAEALTFAQAYLSRIPTIPSATDDPFERRAVDLSDFSARVLARLCSLWFGLPDEVNLVTGGYQPGPPTEPRCPGSLGPASRYMFMPHPHAEPHADFAADGRAHAKAVREAVERWLAGGPDLTGHRLSREIKDALAKEGSEQYLADNIAGTMLGFAPSVQSNFLRVMQTWHEEGSSLWVHQQSLFEWSNAATLDYAQAKSALRGPLVAAIRKHPVPTMAWRSPVEGGTPDTSPSRRVVLGLQSALADANAPDVLAFGRDHADYSQNTTVHGCPGYEMAMGVLLALIGSLMKAGTLRPTGSPVLLILTHIKEQS